ncbi:oxidoreductase [Azoarcus sp. DN11]|nr:oxidoreductase [Azoarcus sp. DN11]
MTLSEAAQADVRGEQSLEVLVTGKRSEAADICSIEFRLPDGGALPEFSAGAHIDVHIDGLVRQYSLCNHPRERERYVIGVLRDPNSKGGSVALHEKLREGDRVRVGMPRNLFPLAPAGRTILIAGGIGVTPILCMAEQLADQGADFELHYCARSRTAAAFVERIAQSRFASRAHCYFDDEPQALRFVADEVLASPTHDTHVYVCGPTGFMDHVLDAAARKGWADDYVHREYFKAPETAADEAASAEFEVEIASSGKVFTIPADRSVVSVLADNGVYIATGCDQGVCGTCLTGVVEGVPEHRDALMSAAERAANNQFTPCCSRSKSRRLVLDL